MISGFASYGPSAASPQGDLLNVYQLSDDVFYTKGKHALKFGVQLDKWNVGILVTKGPSVSFFEYVDVPHCGAQQFHGDG